MSAKAPYLVIETRGNAVFKLLDATTLGRLPENALPLDDPACSSRHAVIRLEGGRWVLEDLGSTNGTWVYDQKLEGPWVLQEGDRIYVGAQVLRVAGLERSCRRCGKELPREAAFCSGCGLPLHVPVPAQPPLATPPPLPAPGIQPPPVPVGPPSLPSTSGKQQILQDIALKLGALGIPFETATRADIVIQTEFLDASWGTGSKKIAYQASALLNDRERTLYFYEFTKETSSGISFGSDSETSFQSGKTLFRKIKRVGYGPDGKAFEITLDLGVITQAFQDAARKHGWQFKTVLSREKAAY